MEKHYITDIITPVSDSATAITIMNAARTVNLLIIDTVNNQINLCNNRISNLLDGTNSTDACTFGQFQGHVTNTSNPHQITKTHIGLDNVENLKVNLIAITDPTSNDDDTQGYSVGSRWVNITSGEEFVCVDATTGSAVWKSTTASSGLNLDDLDQNISFNGNVDRTIILKSPTSSEPGKALYIRGADNPETVHGVGGGLHIIAGDDRGYQGSHNYAGIWFKQKEELDGNYYDVPIMHLYQCGSDMKSYIDLWAWGYQSCTSSLAGRIVLGGENSFSIGNNNALLHFCGGGIFSTVPNTCIGVVGESLNISLGGWSTYPVGYRFNNAYIKNGVYIGCGDNEEGSLYFGNRGIGRVFGSGDKNLSLELDFSFPHINGIFGCYLPVSKKFFMYGGSSDDAKYRRRGYIYDPETNDYYMTSLNEFDNDPTKSHCFITYIPDDSDPNHERVFIYGGTTSTTRRGFIYDVQADSWTLISDIGQPPNEQAYGGVCRYFSDANGKYVIVFGGSCSNGWSPQGGIYNLDSNTWTSIKHVNVDLPDVPARGHDTVWYAFLADVKKCYFWGGDYSKNDGAIYDLATDTWTLMNTTGAPSGRSTCIVEMKTKLLVAGGYRNGGYVNDGAIYDVDTDSWTPITSASGGWWPFVGIYMEADNKVFYLGGRQTGSRGIIYDLSSGAWEFTPTYAIPERADNYFLAYDSAGKRFFTAGWGHGSYTIYSNNGLLYKFNDKEWVYAPVGSYRRLEVGSDFIAIRGHKLVDINDNVIGDEKILEAKDLGVTISKPLEVKGGTSNALITDENSNVAAGSDSITTSSTDGFFYIPSAEGAPTGTPTDKPGFVPMYYDKTNNDFYIYNGAWKKITLT